MQPLSLKPIREAISSGELERGKRLWDSSAERLIEEFQNGADTKARLDEIRELVEWCRTVLLCDRAHLQNQVRRLQGELRVASGYQNPDPEFASSSVAARF